MLCIINKGTLWIIQHEDDVHHYHGNIVYHYHGNIVDH